MIAILYFGMYRQVSSQEVGSADLPFTDPEELSAVTVKLYEDRIIVEEPSVAYADVEDDQILVIQSVLVSDTDPLLEGVWRLLRVSAELSTNPRGLGPSGDSSAWELFDDVEQESACYLGGRERKRRWRLA